jgi:hypothetical protein
LDAAVRILHLHQLNEQLERFLAAVVANRVSSKLHDAIAGVLVQQLIDLASDVLLVTLDEVEQVVPQCCEQERTSFRVSRRQFLGETSHKLDPAHLRRFALLDHLPQHDAASVASETLETLQVGQITVEMQSNSRVFDQDYLSKYFVVSGCYSDFEVSFRQKLIKLTKKAQYFFTWAADLLSVEAVK